ncbi:MAG: RHS repeat-associated core domain-containing protein [Actinomycetes bacterium]
MDADEYGQPRPGTPTPRYGWLGAKQRDTDTPTGLLLMGVRLYNPATGRFLSVDPIPGGNENAYNYPNDPINMFDLDGKWREWLKERWRATRRGASSAGRWLNRHKDTIAVGLAVVGMFTCSICTIAAYGAIAIGTASAVSSCRRGISVGCATGAISAFAGGKARLLRGAAKWALRGARSGHGKLSSFRRAVGRGWLRQARWSDRVSLGTGVASAFCSYRSC